MYLFLDIVVAFPSLVHQSIFIVLRAINAPPNFYNFIVALYTDNLAVNSSGVVKFLGLCGVLQGCGMSRSIFAISFDPFLSALRGCIDLAGKGSSRGCSDGVGVLLRQHGFLQKKLLAKRTLPASVRDSIEISIRPWLCRSGASIPPSLKLRFIIGF